MPLFYGDIVSSLPICHVIDELQLALQAHQQVILQAPPGAGKSTVLPLFLLQQSWLSGKILMLEPRRLAARNVATRLAEQLQESVGQTVGYQIRSENCSNKDTRLEVITEGILTRKLQQDPLLEGVNLVILDEFHERSLHTDLALTLLLDIQQGLRDDLKILIMSATLDNQALTELLADAPLISSEGRMYPVIREYISLPGQKSFDDAIAGFANQLMNQQSGSLLVFLPGVAEIKRVYERLLAQLHDDIDICPLYGMLPFEQQQHAILPAQQGRRKIVLATNIAETSLTIEGINAVLDSTLERVAVFDVKTGITRLVTQRISKSSMIQRAGRAGRLAPGVCWHLISREQAERAVEQSEPEILHCDLADLWLEVLNWGCRNIHQLKWLTLPPKSALGSANNLLHQLSIIDEQGILTADGKDIAQLPCEPRLAAMLVYAKKRGNDALATATMLTAIIEEPPKQGDIDICYWLNHPKSNWNRRASQLQRLLDHKQGIIDIFEVTYLLVAGYPDRIVKQRGHSENYLLASGSGATLDHTQALSANEWLITPVLLQSETNASARILLAAEFNPAILQTDFPHLIKESIEVEWLEERGTLKTVKRKQVGNIVLQQSYLAKPSASQLKQALLQWIKTEGIDKLNWDETTVQLRTRMQLAKEWLPQYIWPDVSNEHLYDNLEQWLLPLLDNVHDIRSLRSVNLFNGLNQLLDWQQKQRLEQLLPFRYQVPTGSVLPIIYSLDRPPVLSVRLQEMFGEKDSPKIAEDQITVTLELLSPASRPLQITSDLNGFWNGAYDEVKKEMRGRYPKHVWPDDPVNTRPTRRTKKYQD